MADSVGKATRDQAIARLVELDVARWGEGERAASLRTARRHLTDADERVLRDGG